MTIKSISNKENFLKSNTGSKQLDPLTWRLILVLSLFVLFASLLFGRLVQLHIAHTDFLQAQGNARTIRIVDIPSFRGMLTDRRGTPLAISSPVHAIWINPQLFHPTAPQQKKLAKLLNLTPKSLMEKVALHPHRAFIYVKRGLTPETAEKIEALKIAGVGLKREFRRYYPHGRQSAQLVGFTDIDDQGQSGLELAFQQELKPTIGKKRVIEDRAGHWVEDLELLQSPRSGQDQALSIDIRIQGFAYRELEKAVEEFHAKSITLVMLDVQTGEILAMATAPSFNPNNRQECHGSHIRNRAVTDLLEPGSTIKPFSIASALETRQFTPETIIETSPGYYAVGNHTVKDVHNYGTLSVREVLMKSSNIGITKITLALPPETLINTFSKLGFGNTINTNFPGERKGMLPAPPKNAFAHATVAFGYGLQVTPLQIAHAYATLATDGEMRPISLLKIDDPSTIVKTNVLPKDIANSTFDMLTDVLTTKGTAKRANIPGYKTAGKTGTVRVVGPHGYDAHRHIGLFAGVTPVDNPRLATVIVVEEPDERVLYGGQNAAPIYRNVVAKALHILNVPPDAATSQQPPKPV